MAARKPAEPIVEVPSASAFRKWLAAHHDRSTGVFLCIPKGATKSDLTYATALDAALAWGWIDSHKRTRDASSWLQRFSPRTRRSPWSKINRAKAEALIAAGKMEGPGLAEVESARNDGRWDRAYDGARASGVPDDLAAALAKNAGAKRFFETLDGANRYAILYRIQTAKKPETRVERIIRYVALCAKQETIHPPRPAAKKPPPRGAQGA